MGLLWCSKLKQSCSVLFRIVNATCNWREVGCPAYPDVWFSLRAHFIFFVLIHQGAKMQRTSLSVFWVAVLPVFHSGLRYPCPKLSPGFSVRQRFPSSLTTPCSIWHIYYIFTYHRNWVHMLSMYGACVTSSHLQLPCSKLSVYVVRVASTHVGCTVDYLCSMCDIHTP